MEVAYFMTEEFNRRRAASEQGWEECRRGNFTEAILIWSELLLEAEEIPIRVNRAWARLAIHDWAGAEEDFRHVRQLGLPDGRRVTIAGVGAACWLAGRREDACKDWAYEIIERREGRTHFADAAGGVDVPALLWWASSHPGLEFWHVLAESELRERWKDPRYTGSGWPRPIAGYLLRELGEAALLELASSPVERLHQRRVCRALFYTGASALRSGQVTAYREQLKLAVAQGLNLIDAEYHLALDELRHLG